MMSPLVWYPGERRVQVMVGSADPTPSADIEQQQILLTEHL